MLRLAGVLEVPYLNSKSLFGALLIRLLGFASNALISGRKPSARVLRICTYSFSLSVRPRRAHLAKSPS